MKRPISEIAARIRKLAQIVDELEGGADFAIVRLTITKGLCEDPEAAALFALHLTSLTRDKMEHRHCPDHIEPEKWSRYKALVATAVRQMKSYLEERTSEGAASLRALLSEIETTQNEYQKLKGGPVRVVASRDLLLVETALHCVLSPPASAYLGYRVAREYAERYDPRYGAGLIPASAPMVEEIADFWCRYHFGKPLNEWLAATAQ